ncbi:MAG: hypothetical protein ABIQ33_07305 [Caldimonas sp.]
MPLGPAPLTLLNREAEILEFNRRVLAQARRDDVPLLVLPEHFASASRSKPYGPGAHPGLPLATGLPASEVACARRRPSCSICTRSKRSKFILLFQAAARSRRGRDDEPWRRSAAKPGSAPLLAGRAR